MNTTVRNTLIFTLLVSTAGMAAAADAQVPTPTKAPKLFQQADANKDGKITKEEGKAHHEAKKKEWDKKRAERKAAKGEGETKPVAPKAE